jgi:hypothetical protein
VHALAPTCPLAPTGPPLRPASPSSNTVTNNIRAMVLRLLVVVMTHMMVTWVAEPLQCNGSAGPVGRERPGGAVSPGLHLRQRRPVGAPQTPRRSRLSIVDHWKALLGTGIATILTVVLLANYGIVGLIALPFVVALALLLLWALLYVGALASLIYSIVLFVQQEYLKAFLFLWLVVILGAIAELVRQAVFDD